LGNRGRKACNTRGVGADVAPSLDPVDSLGLELPSLVSLSRSVLLPSVSLACRSSLTGSADLDPPVGWPILAARFVGAVSFVDFERNNGTTVPGRPSADGNRIYAHLPPS